MKRRNLAFVIIVSIITLGIYSVYWLVQTRKELVRKGQDVPSLWIVFAPLLSLIIVALAQVIVHLMLDNSNPSSGAIEAVNAVSVIIGIISVIGVIPMIFYWTWKYCVAVENVTDRALSTVINFVFAIILTLIGVGFVWPMINQYYFNQLSEDSKHEIPDTPYPKVHHG
jgi:NADH:ubiquinone oxidoreductase subunit 5 (subunit L)/multisubunit Na+/H+ antiporter MnhA subunit